MTKQKLIENNMKLVYKLISKEYPTYLRDEDIIQCGMLGLCKAAEKYDESKAKFSTYAYFVIRSEIQMELRRRAKHQGILSLDYETTNDLGEKCTFGDIIIGDQDVPYVDLGIDVNRLKVRERRVYELVQSGMNYADIGRELGISRQAVWSIIRRLKARVRQ